MSNKEKVVKQCISPTYSDTLPSKISAPSKISTSSVTTCSTHQNNKDKKMQVTPQLPKDPSIIQQATTGTNRTQKDDPISLKNSLEAALGINKEKYWLSIQSFIKGEIKKFELDFYVHSLFPKEQVHLHDEFIRASINTRKKNQSNVKNASSQKKKSLKEIMSSMGKEERDKLHVILKSAQNNQGRVHTNPNLMLFEKKFPKNNTTDDPPTLTTISPPLNTYFSVNEREDELSAFDSIYTKMTEVALDNGLIGGVSEDCANLMIYALEMHLKNILHSCVNKIRSNDFHDKKEKINNSPISLGDLAFSLECTPYILVENNFILERILNKINKKL